MGYRTEKVQNGIHWLLESYVEGRASSMASSKVQDQIRVVTQVVLQPYSTAFY